MPHRLGGISLVLASISPVPGQFRWINAQRSGRAYGRGPRSATSLPTEPIAVKREPQRSPSLHAQNCQIGSEVVGERDVQRRPCALLPAQLAREPYFDW